MLSDFLQYACGRTYGHNFRLRFFDLGIVSGVLTGSLQDNAAVPLGASRQLLRARLMACRKQFRKSELLWACMVESAVEGSWQDPGAVNHRVFGGIRT